MRRLLPLLVAALGLGAGAGAGLALRPVTAPALDPGTDPGTDHHGEPPAASAGADASRTPEYVRLSNQFVVPVIEDGRVAAMVILSLSLEVAPGTGESVFAREPRLRDAFLQVLFDHANAGGFRGSFTDAANLVVLRRALRETAARVLGDTLRDVLIVDIVRQDS